MSPIKILKRLRQYFNKNRLLYNVNKSHHKKNVLISYITHPYANRENKDHTNIPEAIAISDCFEELGYACDVVNHTSKKKINYNKYDIVFGFGLPFEKSFSTNNKILRIYYGTGRHPYFNNIETLKRGINVRIKRGKLILDSLRLVKEDYLLQTVAPDALILIGDESVAQTYKEYTNAPCEKLNASFIKILNYREIVKDKDFSEAKRHFLFLSGSSMVHKGLDILLEAFMKQEGLHLHICAPLKREKEFSQVFAKELTSKNNVHNYDFVKLESSGFENLLKKCAFVVLPSCSEGMPTSILNAVGNGGLIPILTKTSSIGASELTVPIKSPSTEAILDSLGYSQTIEENELKKISEKIGARINEDYTIKNYSENLKTILNKIIYGDNHN